MVYISLRVNIGGATVAVTFYECAKLAAAVYHPEISEVSGFSRHHYLNSINGFQGAVFKTAGPKKRFVVVCSGTDQGVDWAANLGFGQKVLMLGSLNPAIRILNLIGSFALGAQVQAAKKLFALASQEVKQGDTIYLTGHSLGGGLAQIVAAESGCSCVTFNAPSVSGVIGVVAQAKKSKATIIRVQVQGDWINSTLYLDDAYGAVGMKMTLDSARTMKEAHSIDNTRDDLSPWGSSTLKGALMLEAA